ncbi:Cation/calcium exchanger 1 [Ananas comosus]|uniref:Cation/calcium exchanger 1 n=1 Tax=Ananas comosus TaxID=4615 RepID=A0A199V8M8_ANACO|nr:Cation/calcium exchanger 1 [Ananas comosus]
MALFVFNKRNVIVIAISIFLVILLSFFLITNLDSSSSPTNTTHLSNYESTKQDDDCGILEGLKDPNSKCSYIKTHNSSCGPQGYINYLEIFYCDLAKYPVLGYAIYGLWLLILFYLLANTASRYFCSSLESLSKLLKLPPTVAGVTLLSLGNGAPDVFSSVVSFAGGGAGGDLGLSSVLGGALFVATVVVGAISLAVGPRGIAVDRRGFARDAAFLALVLGSLLAVLLSGRIGIRGSVAFLSLYIAYVLIVWASHCCCERKRGGGDVEAPLLNGTEVEHLACVQKEEPVEKHYDNDDDHHHYIRSYSNWLLYLLQVPLYLPRRLTIPDVSEERWSKPFAVASAALAPLLLTALWNSQSNDMGFREKLTAYMFGALMGTLLAIIATETTESAAPPKKCLFPWLLGGFSMSVIWTYMLARELVALLVSIGHIIGISASILGITVLAWGNSLGDLIADVAMAINGGRDGVQIAISGCYAGPIFNTLIGLGLSFVVASWYAYPDPFAVPSDTSLCVTLGFLFGALLWASLVLYCTGMKLNRVLGIGLLGIYFCFLGFRICESMGLGVDMGTHFSL